MATAAAPRLHDPAALAAGLAEAIGAISAAAAEDRGAVLETLAAQAEQLLGCDGVDVHLIDEPGPAPLFRRARLSAHAEGLGAVEGSTWRTGPRAKAILRSGRVVFFEDFQATMTDGGRRAHPWLAEVVSALYVPIKDRERIVGLLDAHWLSRRPADPQVIETADALARCAGAVLVVADLYDAARRSEERLRLMVENVSDAILLADRTGRITYASSSTTRVLGYRPQEMVGRSVFELTHPDETEQARRGFAELVATPGRTSPARWRARHRDGGWRWLEGSVRNLLDEPSVGAILLNYRDVTGRQRMDEVLGELAQGLSAAAGEDFFPSLGRFLADHLGVGHVLIGELEPDGATIRSAALMIHGQLIEGIRYGLAGTPSEAVVSGGEPRVFAEGVWAAFPADAILEKRRVEGWVGVPLFTRDGRSLGLIAAMDERPIADPDHVLAVLGLVAKRVEVELERRHVDQALRASEARFRAVVDQSWEGVVLLDADHCIVYASPSHAAMFGETEEDRRPGQRLPVGVIHPDDLARTQDAWPDIAQTPGARRAGVYRRRHRDGSWRWVEGVITNQLHVPELRAYVMTLRDVTSQVESQEALRGSEQRYRSIVETSHEGTWVIDPEGYTTFANARMAEMLGTTVDELIGRPVVDFVDPADRPALVGLRERRREGIREQYEFRFRRANGGELWALVSASPLTDGAGTYAGALVVAFDVGERRAFEEAQRAAERRVAQQDKLRSLGQMASGIAHDLNQALALIAGYGEVARGALEEPEVDVEFVREALDRSVRAAVTGGQTLKRLLTFARPTADAPPDGIAAADLLNEIAELTAPRWRDATAAEGRPIRMRVEVDDGLRIVAVLSQLREALTNLIFNAVDAMPHGGTIHLRARQRGGQVELTVTDGGVGMTAEVRARVFEPFFTTKGEGGTGLGLPQVRAVVEQLGGGVELESAPNQGTTVRLFLPTVVGEPVAVASAEAVQTEVGRPLRVLLVEDHEELAVAAALMLRKHGHDVRHAPDGEAALAQVDEWRPDVVLSDLSLGSGINGWELAQQLR